MQLPAVLIEKGSKEAVDKAKAALEAAEQPSLLSNSL